ncbi:hypothetical protein F4813DRAFT_358601 [Daldinia decipiens]|uniref:uncharacterized protein n=1 Tax=Daldinia decipiens TaxID=326647 RepID=UPI0020C35AEF|nr:uncharacterized protein F4813DRAFT_358601 [Daldinia decipiens]KAI1657971.1 hypothetical protein F4813DRAFT_358601 [Daldinia decipiens]
MATDWNKLKVVDLKSELKRLGLPQNGLKADLVARLEAADSERAASQSSDEAPEEPEAINGEAQPVEIAPEAAEAPEVTEAPEVSESSPPDESPKQSEAEAEAVPAQEVSAPAVTETQAALESSASETPLQVTELIQDSQKRKRRSLSPAPSADGVAHKRARQESRDSQEDRVASSTEEKVDAVVEPQEEKKESVTQTPPDIEMEGVQDEVPIEREHSNGVVQSTPTDDANPDVQNGHAVEVVTNKTQAIFETPKDEPSREQQPYTAHPAEIERDVEPSIHPATSALYIKDFMRPLRLQTVKDHLLDLATPMGAPIEEGTIVDFYLDTIRTHAFVVFNTISSASRVRTALHNRVWPDETNRKALWVDFIPSERFAEWVDMEQTSTGGRGSTNRYEVMYDNDEDGNVIVKLEEFDGAGPTTKQAPPAPEPQPERKPSIPTGPSRPFPGVEGAPTGPRNFNSARAPASHPSRAGRLEQPGQSTNACPSVTYQPVPDELVRRRLDTIAAAKTKDFDRDFGKEYKRYYFENGETLVDRGPEIFLGIRPPHRERERQREREQRREPVREPAREPAREPGRGRRGSGGKRRGGMPIFHGVPRGGDRFRPGDSSASGPNGRSRYADDRGSRRDGHGHGRDRPSRRDNYSRY